MSPRITTVIQDGGHVTRRSVVFLFLDFDSSVKRFSYNCGHYNMVFLYSTQFCLYTVSWYHQMKHLRLWVKSQRKPVYVSLL